MYLSSLRLLNFRNYSNCTIQFQPRGAIFYGDNGEGKTNLIESIHFISIGRSQRGAAKSELIQHNAHELFVEGNFLDPQNNSSIAVSIGISRDKKVVIKKNKQKLQLFSQLFDLINIISFGPHDLKIIYGDPLERRKFIDITISQTDKDYLKYLILYKKCVNQRNKLLSSEKLDNSIEIYEEQMADYGSKLFFHRMRFFNEISLYFNQYFTTFNFLDGKGTLQYMPSLGAPLPDNRKDLKDLFFNALSKRRSKDIQYGFTSIGPQRDDFKCLLNAKPVKIYGSHGQCRAMAISLKLCALQYIEKKNLQKPIILLDDIFNELDNKKVKNIFPLFANRGQLFITSLIDNDILFKEMEKFTIKDNTIYY